MKQNYSDWTPEKGDYVKNMEYSQKSSFSYSFGKLKMIIGYFSITTILIIAIHVISKIAE